jgi:hypothetical protein
VCRHGRPGHSKIIHVHVGHQSVRLLSPVTRHFPYAGETIDACLARRLCGFAARFSGLVLRSCLSHAHVMGIKHKVLREFAKCHACLTNVPRPLCDRKGKIYLDGRRLPAKNRRGSGWLEWSVEFVTQRLWIPPSEVGRVPGSC